jgi:hypothetical protein
MTVEDLIRIEEIKQLKARYCFYLDTKQWDDFAGTLAEDITIDCDTAVSTNGRDPQTLPRVTGRATQRRAIEQLAAEAYTVHQVHSPIIELTSATTAKGIWAMEDVIDKPGFYLHARGHYHETYRKEADGKWYIASIHLTRTLVETRGESNWP